jgi:hypothetical protein
VNPFERDKLCQLYVESLSQEGDDDPLASLAAAVAHGASPRPAVGQLWRAVRHGRPGQALVALTHLGDVARGVVASPDTFLAATDDVLVPGADSPTGEALTLHTWLDVPIRLDALAGCVGTLPPHVVEPLLMFLQRQITGGFVLRAQESLEGAGPEAVRWSIAPRGAPDRARAFVTGSHIIDDADGRVAARVVLRGVVAWVAEDALAALSDEGHVKPWHIAFADSLRSALRAIGASFDVPETEFGAGAPAFGLTSLGAMSLSSLPPLGALLVSAVSGGTPQLALRQGPAERGDEMITFALPVGGARVSAKVHAREGEIDLLVMARKESRPLRGLKVTVRVDGVPFGAPRATDRGGFASIAGIAVKPGARVEMEFSHGRVKHLVSVA